MCFVLFCFVLVSFNKRGSMYHLIIEANKTKNKLQVHAEGLSKVVRQGMDKKGWLQGEAHRKAKSLATGWGQRWRRMRWKTGKLARWARLGSETRSQKWQWLPHWKGCWQFQIKQGAEVRLWNMKLVVINKEVTVKAMRLMYRALE